MSGNYDLRWEWFARPGEIYAVSGFYKGLSNPIERAIITGNGGSRYQNVDRAVLKGAEFEARKRLDQLSSHLGDFQVGPSLVLVHSEVAIAEAEMAYKRPADPDVSDVRPLQGQSPYVINLDLVYDNRSTATSATLHYNMFGPRPSGASLRATSDVYERERGVLDPVVRQRTYRGFGLKLRARNLLNVEVAEAHEYKGNLFYYSRYSHGRSYTIGFTYNHE